MSGQLKIEMTKKKIKNRDYYLYGESSSGIFWLFVLSYDGDEAFYQVTTMTLSWQDRLSMIL